MIEPLIVIVFVAIVVVAFVVAGGNVFRGPRPEDRLLKVCRGNRDQVERLIHGELQRAPGIPRHEAAARALVRYQRDNR